MSDRTIRIIDPSRRILATARVAEEDGSFAGSIDVGSMPRDILRRFEAYEEIVEGQMFSLLDEIEDQISGLTLSAIFDDGQEFLVEDLQVYPSSGRVSFKVKARRTQRVGATGDPATLHIVSHVQDESRNPA
jgi:hypothetical protein